MATSTNQIVLKEAERSMTICNACRHCEGFCAVFPAMERKRVINGQDLKLLANLCHNCRACYYACPYTQPHEYNLNLPRTLSELRLATYQEFAWPSCMGFLLEHNARATAFLAVLSVVFVFCFALIFQGPEILFTRHLGPGAFYTIAPYPAVVIPFSLLALGVLFLWAMGVWRFWKAIGAPFSALRDISGHIHALKDMLTLRSLGGVGRSYAAPNKTFAMARRSLHHAVFYGFVSCFLATCLAFLYEHLFGWYAPFPYYSLPVILGTLGGLGICCGSAGLFFLQNQTEEAAFSPLARRMDKAFLILVFLTSFSGLALLVFRETHAMGLLLTLHLGFVLAFFLCLPYGKFLHALYRYFALLRDIQEQRSGSSTSLHG